MIALSAPVLFSMPGSVPSRAAALIVILSTAKFQRLP